MNKILIDSNILIYFVNGEVEGNKVFLENSNFSVSIITYMEVMGFSFKNDFEEQTFKEIFSKLNIIYIDYNIASLVIQIRKNKKMKLPDSIIAATCIQTQSTLMTRNESDFQSIEGIKIINPFENFKN